MTRSDMMTAAAVTTGASLEMNGRTVSTERGRTTVSLHGTACLSVSRTEGTVTLSGDALPTRKSCRMMNAVLSQLGAGEVMTREGRWLHRDARGRLTPFSGRDLTVPILF
jgi:hypothetical protein